MAKLTLVLGLVLLSVACAQLPLAQAQNETDAVQSGPGGYEFERVSIASEDSYRIMRKWNLWVNDTSNTLVATGIRVRKANESGVVNLKIDGIRFTAMARYALGFAVSYFDKDITGANTPTPTFSVDTARAGFAVKFTHIIVYENTNGQDGFQEGSDTVKISFDLHNLPALQDARPGWDFVMDPIKSYNLNGEVVAVRALTLHTANRAFGMRVFSGNRAFHVDGNRVRPDDLKITFAFNTSVFPQWQDSWKLAFRAVVISTTSRTEVTGTDLGSIDVSGDSIVKTGFNWAKSVNITENGVRVVRKVLHQTEMSYTADSATILAGLSGYTATRVTFSLGYDHTNLTNRVIEWDPAAAIDVDYAALDASAGIGPSSASAVAFQPLLAALFAVVAVFFGNKMFN